MNLRISICAAAAVLLSVAANTAFAATVTATTADAGSSVSVAQGDTLVVRLPGEWTLVGDLTPELVLDHTSHHGHGARGTTEFDFAADAAGAASFQARNTLTKAPLSILIDVMAPQH